MPEDGAIDVPSLPPGDGGGGSGGDAAGNDGPGDSPGTFACEGSVAVMGGDTNPTFLPPACSGKDADHWSPMGGPNGGLIADGSCGSRTGNCPTSYVEGNVGAPCTTDRDCTGLDPVCLTGAKYAGGTCSSRGCELFSNKGCPPGDYCLDAGGETYCVEGCGIDESGCFVGCNRPGFACFNSESKTLGYCLYGPAIRQCDPSQGIHCTTPEFGDGLCDHIAWDDPTIGRCFETCNPIAQDCTRDTDACYTVRDMEMPVCYQHVGRAEGEACTRNTHCGEGLTCQCDFDDRTVCTQNTKDDVEMRCRRYCVPGCDQCGPGYRCRRIPGWPFGACIPT